MAAISQMGAQGFEGSLKGALVVCLLPTRTDTRWWQDYVKRGHVCVLRGRLKFGEAKNAAPFPSAIVIFGKYFSHEKEKEKRDEIRKSFVYGKLACLTDTERPTTATGIPAADGCPAGHDHRRAQLRPERDDLRRRAQRRG
jgi:hypothetical protein